MAPNTLVITNCPILPVAIATTPTIRLLGDRKNTLPPYSPNLFGVKTAQVKPQKTDSIASFKLMGSMGLIIRRHLKASIPQLANIKATTKDITTQI